MNLSILEYGTGNLHSLAKVLQAEGVTVTIESDPATAATADAVVLPGVGAFAGAAARLSESRVLRDAIAGGLPCLGICLGMQLLYEGSDEGGGAGLGLMPGRSRRVVAARVPQMGWNDVEPVRQHPLFDGLDEIVVYYANSYVVQPADDGAIIAYTSCGQDRFPAVVKQGNVWGMQFHPEKSGATGRRLMHNFLNAVRNP